MPPSGCYFSRDNKNYRLSGLENNRSNGLPPDRGLHSLRLDTQAVAALRCSPFLLFILLFCFAFPFSSSRSLFAISVSFSPSPSPSRSWGRVFHSTPLRIPSRSFALRCSLPCNIFAAGFPAPLAYLQLEIPVCIEPLQSAIPPHYHFTYYTL